MSYKLSFCIPTYNRADFIGQTLESIISQATSDIEIVVSDNASNDRTEEIVIEYMRHFPNIRYFRWETNMGADRNYLKAVELASGEFCWLLGSDDLIRQGAIPFVLGELKCNYDIYLLNRVDCDFEMNEILHRKWLSSDVESQVFDFSEPGRLIKYFASSKSLGALFSYLSSIIVKKSSWDDIDFDESYHGTAYSHVFIILSMVNSGAILRYCKECLVYNRGGNDSFKLEGDLKRFLLDIDGYHKLGYDLFKDSTLRNAFFRVMLREHPYYRILKMACLINPEEGFSAKQKFIDMGYHKIIVELFFQLRPLGPLVLLANRVKNRIFTR